MPFIACPECTRQISFHAASCPTCGYPVRFSKPAALGYIAAAVIAAAAYAPILSDALGSHSFREHNGYLGTVAPVGAFLLAIAAFARAPLSSLIITIVIAVTLCIDFAAARDIVLHARLRATEGFTFSGDLQIGWGWLLLLLGVVLSAVFSLRALAVRRRTLANAKNNVG